MLGRWQLPAQWEWVQAADVADIIGGGTPPSKDDSNFAQPGSGIPWIGPADLTGYDATYISRGRRDLSKKGLARSGATLMPKGAVLFSSRAPIGYCAIAENEVSTNQGFKSWVCADCILPEYVRHYLRSSVEYVDSLASGTTFREVSGKRFGAMAFPLSPESEQRRIVAKLDALTTRLALMRSELDRVPVLAERLRRTSRFQAMTGGLLDRADASWAESKLLPDLPSEFGSISYPADWSAVRISAAAENHDGKRIPIKASDRADRQGPYPYYGASGPIDTFDSFIFDGEHLLIGEDGANLLSRSTPIAFLADGKFWVNNHAHILKARPGTSNAWLAAFINAMDLKPYVSGSAQPKLTQGNLNRISVPMPPPAEQQRILAILANVFARADRLEADANHARALIDRLESAILAKAFRGKLVPQDPRDEAAGVLLDRIRAQRAAALKPKRVRRVAKTSPA